MACAGGKNSDQVVPFEETPPFKVTLAFYQPWVAGVKSGGKGMNLGVILEEMTEDVEIGDFFFREQVVRARRDPNNPDLFIASYKEEPRDVVMDADPLKEAQNIPPINFPFDLDEDEMALSYSYQGETYFVLIKDLEKRPLLAYPGQGGQIDDEH